MFCAAKQFTVFIPTITKQYKKTKDKLLSFYCCAAAGINIVKFTHSFIHLHSVDPYKVELTRGI
jgi:hypothetical protein